MKPGKASNVKVFVQVTCLALSKSGKLLASGQVTTISGLARIIIWDLQTGKELRHMEMHQVWNFSQLACSQLASIGCL